MSAKPVPNPVLPPPCDVIRIARSARDLTGEGLEYLVYEDGVIAAKLFNGQIMGQVPAGNSEVTKPQAGQ